MLATNYDLLGYDDLLMLLTLSHKSLTCRDIKDFENLVLGLKQLVEFEYAVCARAEVPNIFTDLDAQPHVLDISYPSGYLEVYFENKLHLTDATLCSFLFDLEPVHWKTLNQNFKTLYPSGQLAYDFGMRDGWTYGAIDTKTMQGSQFALTRTTTDDNPQKSCLVLEYIIPFFAEAYGRILEDQGKSTVRLTKRETEVLNWLKDGKSSWEISMILNCSRRVVDFHVGNIKGKLNCVNRAQVVAVALHHGLIEF